MHKTGIKRDNIQEIKFIFQMREKKKKLVAIVYKRGHIPYDLLLSFHVAVLPLYFSQVLKRKKKNEKKKRALKLCKVCENIG